MLNQKLYKPHLLMKGISAIAGEQTEFKPLLAAQLPKTPLIDAFLADDDIQEITCISTNLGMVRTFRKQFKGC